MKKKLLSVVTAFLILITTFVTVLPANAWVQYTSPGSVKGSDYTDNPAFAKALDDLFAGDIDLYKDSKRTKEVSMPLGFRVSMNDPYYMYSTSRKTQTYGWTCFIYSNGAFNKLFGEYVHRGDSLKNCYIAVGKGASKMTYDLLKNADIRAGAYIRTSPKSDGSYYGNDGHSMIILAYDEKYITYLEGNGDGKGLVRVTKRTYAEFNSAQLTGRGRKITHIVQPTEKWFNELYGNSPENNTYTFSYNAYGGTGSADSFTVKYGNEFSLSSPNFDRDGCELIGWSIKRNSDDKWYTESGWLTQDQLPASGKTTFANGEILEFNDSFIADTSGDVSYTAYAVWETSPIEECNGINLISNTASREAYPLSSTVSFEGSIVEFTFASGKTARVTIDDKCSSTVPQSFRLNGRNYSFYINSKITAEGDNPCSISIGSYTGIFTTLKGGKKVIKTEVNSSPSNISGENAEITLTYSDNSTETLTTTRFIPINSEEKAVSGIMWTSGGFTIDWCFNINEKDEKIAVNYGCDFSAEAFAGDVNLDGNINTGDLASMKLVLMEAGEDFYYLYCVADFNRDGAISTTDLSLIKLNLSAT